MAQYKTAEKQPQMGGGGWGQIFFANPRLAAPVLGILSETHLPTAAAPLPPTGFRIHLKWPGNWAS